MSGSPVIFDRMAETSSPPNPFLGDQTPQVPEKSVAETGAASPAPVSVASTTPTPPPSPFNDVPVDDDIPTPSSKWRHRSVWRGLIALVLVFLIAGGLYWWFRDTGDTPALETPAPVADVKEPAAPVARPADEPLALSEDDANFESENFKAGEIVIGGDIQFLVDADEIGVLLVENIRGEAFTEKNKQDVKLVVTWTTNKLAQASVNYSKGIGQTEQSVEEDDYSYNHSVIISGLDPASTYLYTIDAMDRYGNRVKSEPHAVFTGARTVSLFDLIAGAIGEVFGWAVTNK